MDKAFNKKRIGYLILGTAVLMFAGVIYAWSNLSTPLYKFGWTETSITLNYTITVLAFAAGGVVSGVLSKKLSVKQRLAPSAVFLVLGFWISSLLKENSNIIILYLSYGILAGLGIGIIYNTVISTVTLWFPEKKGFCVGTLMAGFGIGSFFISLIAGKLMAAGIAWQTVYRVLAILCGVVIFTGAVILRQPDENTVLPAVTDATHALASHNYTPKEMVKTRAFWLVFFAHAFLAGVGNSIFPVSKNILLSVKMSDSTAIIVSSAVSILNSGGRIVAGEIEDHFSLRFARIFACSIAGLGCVLSLIGMLITNAFLCTAGIFICALSYGFPSTLQSATALEYYGKENYSLNYSIINFDTAVCAFFPTIFTSISNAVGKSYIGGFWFLIGTCVVTLIMCLAIHRPKFAEKSITE